MRWRSTSVLALSAGVALYVAASLRWEVPWAAGGLYAVMSLVCYLSYAADKTAAREGGWRTSERTLLWLGLACGWPGAILAQERLRHKSAKLRFRGWFWLTVVLNLLGFALLFTPLLPEWSPLYPFKLLQRTQY